MNATMPGKSYLDQLAGGLPALLSGAMERIFDPGANSVAFDSLTWRDLSATACLVLLVSLVHGSVVAFRRYKIRQTASKESKELRHHVFGALGKSHNPFQIRSRVMVAMRWLTHIDSITWKRDGAGGPALKQAASGEGNAA